MVTNDLFYLFTWETGTYCRIKIRINLLITLRLHLNQEKRTVTLNYTVHIPAMHNYEIRYEGGELDI